MERRLTQSSMHPMIGFKVVGFRTTDVRGAIMQNKPKPIPVEAQREYHIGLVYPHKPVYEGVLYQIEHIIGANLSDDYINEYRASPYTDQMMFCAFQLINCPHCNPPSVSEMIDERRAPGA